MYRVQLDKRNELQTTSIDKDGVSLKVVFFVTFIFRWSYGSSRRFTLPTNGWKKNCKLTSGWIQDA